MIFVITFSVLFLSNVSALSREILTGTNHADQFSDLTLSYLNQLPQIVYQDQIDQQLKLIQCSSLDCTSWNTTSISSLGGLSGKAGEFCSIYSSSVDSMLYISSLWGPNNMARVWKCSTELSCQTEIINNSTLDLYAFTIVQHSTPEQHLTYIKRKDHTLYYQHVEAIGLPIAPEKALIRGVTNKASLAIAADDGLGFAFIALYHPSYDNIWFVRCHSQNCDTWSTIENIDQGTGSGSSANVGSYVSMTLSGSQVYLAYYWIGSSALRAMFCPSIDSEYDKCQAFTVEDPGAVKVGKYTSIALNQQRNKFYISYYDESNGQLRVAACNLELQCNVNAADFTSGHNVGLFSSAAIDSSGLLSVTYLDDTNHSLLYLRRNFGQPYIDQQGTTALAQTVTGSPLILPSSGSTGEDGSSIWTGTTGAAPNSNSTTGSAL